MVVLPTLQLLMPVHIALSCVVQEMQRSALEMKAVGHPKVRSSCTSAACKKPNSELRGKQNCTEP